MTVYQNMAFSLKIRRMPKPEIDRRIKEATDILKIGHLLHRKPRVLSGGEMQRVALGRAMVRDPKVFLMDEPLSNLDAELRMQMRTEITKLHQRLQTTFIYVTYDQTEAMTMGNRIVVMKDGYIQQVDTPQNPYDHPANLFVAGFIGSPRMNFLELELMRDGDQVYGVFGEHRISIPGEIIRKMNGRSYIGRTVLMGVRPEHIHTDTFFFNNSQNMPIPARVELVENMGAEIYLHLAIPGKEDTLTARVDVRTMAKSGDTMHISFDTNHLHFLDKDTEASILR
jgi:multiple sugar transport system ATP-binding protein